MEPSANDLTIVPATLGYSFLSASGNAADFRLVLNSGGSIVVDPRYASFVEATGRNVRIKGYRITLYTTLLSHAVLPMLVGWRHNELAPGLNQLTLIPAEYGYAFISASGIIADFEFFLGNDGATQADSRFAGFVEVMGSTIKLKGFGLRLREQI